MCCQVDFYVPCSPQPSARAYRCIGGPILVESDLEKVLLRYKGDERLSDPAWVANLLVKSGVFDEQQLEGIGWQQTAPDGVEFVISVVCGPGGWSLAYNATGGALDARRMEMFLKKEKDHEPEEHLRIRHHFVMA